MLLSKVIYNKHFKFLRLFTSSLAINVNDLISTALQNWQYNSYSLQYSIFSCEPLLHVTSLLTLIDVIKLKRAVSWSNHVLSAWFSAHHGSDVSSERCTCPLLIIVWISLWFPVTSCCFLFVRSTADNQTFHADLRTASITQTHIWFQYINVRLCLFRCGIKIKIKCMFFYINWHWNMFILDFWNIMHV